MVLLIPGAQINQAILFFFIQELLYTVHRPDNLVSWKDLPVVNFFTVTVTFFLAKVYADTKKLF